MQDLSALLVQLGYDPRGIEAAISWTIYLTIASIIAAIPTGMVAKRKGRSVTGWVIFELCVPVLPLLLLWILPASQKAKAGSGG